MVRYTTSEEVFMRSYAAIREEIYREDGRKYPAGTLVDMELRPAFDEAKEYRIGPMLAANEAQLVMLAEQGIVSREDARKIFDVMENVDYKKYRSKEYTGEFEDLFFQIEDELIKKTDGLAGNIHIARSRNDLCLAIDHLVVRDSLFSVIKEMVKLLETVGAFAAEHKDTLYVAHTHTQHAQPSVFGHYFLGFFDVLCRDIERMTRAYDKANSSPLGAAAITTSGFPVDRDRVAELMGFSSVIENSFDAIGDIDYDTDTATAVMIAAVDIGRVVTDMVLWATEEMNMIRVADGYISTSSIMPQKRNPIALEHLRSSLSMVKGMCATVIDGYFKSPYGDISDHEDIDPVMVQALELFIKNIRILRSVIATLDVNKELLEKRAHESFSVVTEMADTIVRITPLAFRTAHHIVATLVKEAEAKGYNLKQIDEAFFRKVYTEVTGEEFSGDFQQIALSMDPVHFVKIRNVYGGVGPEAMEAMIRTSESKLDKWTAWIDGTEKHLDNAIKKRKDAVESIYK